MKKVRKPCLPPGWYPRDPAEINSFLRRFRAGTQNAAVSAAAAPHAGWYYSGAIAARAAAAAAGSSGEDSADTVAVIGGHLPAGMRPLFAMEDAALTPLGELELDAELREILKKELDGEEDRRADNTVETLLPMVKFFFPRSRLLWLRFPADPASFEAGKALAKAAESLGRRIKTLGSTDLTHYGPNYGFTPQGNGAAALEWVKSVNDRRFIGAVLEGNPDKVLELAEKEKSACSAGAILGVMGFSAALGETKARLIEYGTSADAGGISDSGTPPESFVGYAAFSWP